MSELKPETLHVLEWLGETTERDRILALCEQLRGEPFLIEPEPSAKSEVKVMKAMA